MTDNRGSLDLHDPWAFQPDRCPCDVEFVDWFLQRYQTASQRVFHLGPGDHHYVGRNIAGDSRRPNVVTALTLSPGEVETYLHLVSVWPGLAARYQVVFGDLYQLDRRLLPTHTIATLFHVGETNTRTPTSEAIEQAIRDVYGRGVDNGPMLFYNGSSAWDRVAPILAKLEGDLLQRADTYKHLVIYR